MSNPYQRRLSLGGINTSNLSPADLKTLIAKMLDAKIHGICFSPYVEGQGPGTTIREQQLRDRLSVVAPYVRWVRTFSCTRGHEHIPQIAAELGLRSLVGIWLDNDRENNEAELAGGIAIAKSGHADILAIGNEVLLRGDLTEDELIEFIERAKANVPSTPVGYVDAYFKFVDHPRVTAACDVVLANCYPFWEGCPAEHALLYMKEMYRRAESAAGGKPVIVAETGWPNIGSATDGAIPSYEGASKYFIDTYRWAQEDDIEIFYFSAFDESWKVGKEGDVGAFWGLWDKDGKPKYF